MVVAGFTYRTPPSRGLVGCSYFVGPATPYRPLHLRLTAPLGARRIVDADTGRRIALLAGQRALVPRYVPPGYRTDPDAVDSGPESLSRAEPAAITYFNGPGSSNLYVRLASASNDYSDGRVAGRVHVNGAEATVRISQYNRCVSWDRPGGLSVDVCAGPPATLSTDELLKVARSLH